MAATRTLIWSGRLLLCGALLPAGCGGRGETVGFRNVIIRYPRRHFTVIVLTNRDAPEPYALALAIAKLYVPEADAERAAGGAAGPDPRARPLPPQAQ